MWRSYIDYFLFFPPNCTLMNNLYKIKKKLYKELYIWIRFRVKVKVRIVTYSDLHVDLRGLMPSLEEYNLLNAVHRCIQNNIISYLTAFSVKIKWNQLLNNVCSVYSFHLLLI